MIGYVYYLWDKDETNIFYVGSTVNPEQRLAAHNSQNSVYDHDRHERTMIKKRTNYEMDILEELDVADKFDILKCEVYWINQMREWGFNLNNTHYYNNLDLNLKTRKIKKDNGITINLKYLPEDVMDYIINMQSEFKLQKGIKQFSLSASIIKIIREHKENRESGDYQKPSKKAMN